MQVRKVGLPILLGLGIVGMLGAMLMLPGNSFAWSSCTLSGSITMLVGDVAAEPDGTLFAVIADPNNNISVRRFESGSCQTTNIGIDTGSKAKTKDMDHADFTGVNPEGPIEAFEPKIAVSPSGDVVVTYRSLGTAPYTVYIQRKPANANSFDNPVAVTDNGYVGGVAIDANNKVHVVWYRSGTSGQGGFYRRYNANDNLEVGTKTLSSFADAEPEVAVDSQGNAHTVFMVTNNDTRYRKISAAGSLGSEKDIASTGGPSIYPDIAVSPDDTVHIAWQGRASSSGGTYQPYYRHCDNDGGSCGAQKKLQNSSTNTAAVDVTACGSGPYVTWYNKDSNDTNKIWVSENLGSASVQDDGSYNASDNAAGFVHVLFRNADGKAAYLRQADNTCTSGPITPTNTPTVTNTPTITLTPTEGPSPTPSLTPTVTLTPVAPGKKVQVDDKATAMQYAGSWSVQNGSPSCLYKGSFHYADGNAKNRATLEFVGTRIKLWYVNYSAMGDATVFIDGQKVKTISMKGGSSALCKSWTSNVLPLGTHTVQLRGVNGSGRVSLDVITIFP